MSKGRILAVDDQRYFRELLEGLLVEEGYEVVTAASGEEALRILEQSRFDILLTDLVMPGMDGSDLVHRVKERDPDQDIVVITGVVDVKTAVDAMKLGAAEYLIKPFDRATLAASLEKILQSRRLEAEHDRLLAENIEYMGERSLFERSAALFSTLAVDPLAARVVEGLCVETRAQAGVAWVANPDHPARYDLVAVRGLVQVGDERDALAVEDLPAALVASQAATLIRPAVGGSGEALWVALRRDDRLLGAVRLTDKLGGELFDSVDQACCEKFAHFGATALANALRFASLQRRSLADPVTGAYGLEYFLDVVRTEIEKSNRFGRSFTLAKIDLSVEDPRRATVNGRAFHDWLGDVGALLQSLVRGADVLASDSEGRFLMLLPETDSLGGALFKRRTAEAFAESALFGGPSAGPPRGHLACVSFPVDGTQIEQLLRVLDERIAADRSSPIRRLSLAGRPLAESLAALAAEGEPERIEVPGSIVRFLLGEVARSPEERGLFIIGPGPALAAVTREGLEALAGLAARTEVVVVSEDPVPAGLCPPVSWMPPPAYAKLPSFAVRYGDGAVYALVLGDKDEGDGRRMYHTDDPTVVEHLAFALQRELSLPEVP